MNASEVFFAALSTFGLLALFEVLVRLDVRGRAERDRDRLDAAKNRIR